MNWVLAISFSALMSALTIISLKTAGGQADLTGSLLLYFGAGFLSLLIICGWKYGFQEYEWVLGTKSMMWLTVAGVFLACNEVFFLLAIHLGMPLGPGKLVYSILAVLILTVIGLLVFQENINLKKGIGMCLSIAGIFLILKD